MCPGSNLGHGRADPSSGAPRTARLEFSCLPGSDCDWPLPASDGCTVPSRSGLSPSPEKQNRRQRTWRSYSCNISDLFPPLVLFSVGLEPWLEASVWHVLGMVAVIGAAHLVMLRIHNKDAEYHVNLIDLDEDEEEFPQRLGLRY